MNRRALFIACLVLLTLGQAAPSLAGGCGQAKGLFTQSLSMEDPGRQAALLRQVVRLCPGHAEAWNNLGVLLENQGELDKAAKHYDRALAADPSFLLPHAGLGDIAFKKNLDARAVEHYRRFLGWLKNNGAAYLGRNNVGTYARTYQYKLSQAQDGAERLQRSQRGRIAKAELVRGLRPVPLTRAPGGVRPRQSRVELSSVRFGYNSSELTPQGRRQLDEMAAAMQDGELASFRFLIEGHTDTLGGEAYNLRLSQARAQRVKAYLQGRGVSASRLKTKGMGESNPLVPGGNKEEQAANRRVAFVNLGQ